MARATSGDPIDGAANVTADGAADASSVSAELRRTPLEAEHLRLGAKMAPFAGWQMPIEYEGALAEHRAVRTHVGLFDLTHLGKVEVVGTGALDVPASRDAASRTGGTASNSDGARGRSPTPVWVDRTASRIR